MLDRIQPKLFAKTSIHLHLTPSFSFLQKIDQHLDTVKILAPDICQNPELKSFIYLDMSLAGLQF
jgi:hypothetical protein